MSGSCARASLARAQLPDIDSGSAAIHAAAVTAAAWIGAAGPPPTGLEPVTTGSSPPDEAAVRPRPAVTGDHPRLPGRRTRRGEFADREAGVISRGDVGQLRAGESPARNCPTGSAAIHAAAVTAAAWIAALPVLIRQVSEPVTTGSVRRTRPQCGLRPAATGDHPRLPGRRTRRVEFADREAVGDHPVAMSGSCARASLARAQLPDIDR